MRDTDISDIASVEVTTFVQSNSLRRSFEPIRAVNVRTKAVLFETRPGPTTGKNIVEVLAIGDDQRLNRFQAKATGARSLDQIAGRRG